MKHSISRTSVIFIAGISALILMPFVLNEYRLDFLVMLLINAILVVSFRFIALMGQINFAHVALMGAGAYTTAIMVKNMGLPWELSLLMSGLIPAGVALALSYPLLRMKGFYFFIGSFAAGETMRLCWVRFEFFGRQLGIERIPPLTLGITDSKNLIAFYFLTLTITLICIVVMYRLEHSRIGDTFKAISAQDFLAQSVGINLWKYKTLAFVTGAFFAGIAGFLFAHRLAMVDAFQFQIVYNLQVVVWAVLGGLGNFFGPLIGLSVLMGVEEVIHYVGRLETWSPFIYGVVLIVILLFLPEGLVSFPKRISSIVTKRRGLKDIFKSQNKMLS